MWIWLVLGCLLLIAAAVVVAYMEGTTLGPYATRLLAIGVLCAGYFGLLRGLRFGHARAVARWHFLHYVVPVAAGAGALYCLYHVARNWRSEVHTLTKTVLKLVLVLVLGALAWLCVSR